MGLVELRVERTDTVFPDCPAPFSPALIPYRDCSPGVEFSPIREIPASFSRQSLNPETQPQIRSDLGVPIYAWADCRGAKVTLWSPIPSLPGGRIRGEKVHLVLALLGKTPFANICGIENNGEFFRDDGEFNRDVRKRNSAHRAGSARRGWGSRPRSSRTSFAGCRVQTICCSDCRASSSDRTLADNRASDIPFSEHGRYR